MGGEKTSYRPLEGRLREPVSHVYMLSPLMKEAHRSMGMGRTERSTGCRVHKVGHDISLTSTKPTNGVEGSGLRFTGVGQQKGTWLFCKKMAECFRSVETNVGNQE